MGWFVQPGTGHHYLSDDGPGWPWVACPECYGTGVLVSEPTPEPNPEDPPQ